MAKVLKPNGPEVNLKVNEAKYFNKEVQHRELGVPNVVKIGSEEEAKSLRDLEKAMNLHTDDFVDRVKNNREIDLDPAGQISDSTMSGMDLKKFVRDGKYLDKKNQKMASQLDGMNLYYNRRLLLLCGMPLAQGINAQSVMESVGMYLGMCAVSKEFRDAIKSTKFNNKLEKIDKAIMKGKISEEDGIKRKREMMTEKLGRPFWSPRSAGAAQIGMALRTYELMREPGANVQEVMKDYDEAIAMLRAQAKADGVSMKDMDQSARIAAGRLMMKDPNIALVFNETSLGGINIDDFHKETDFYTDENGKTYRKEVERWTGEFSDANGNMFTGTFTPRPPRDNEGYASKYRDFIYENISECDSWDEVRAKVRTNDFTEKHGEYSQKMKSCMATDGLSFDKKTVHDVQSKGAAEAYFRHDINLDPNAKDLINRAYSDREFYDNSFEFWKKIKWNNMDSSYMPSDEYDIHVSDINRAAGMSDDKQTESSEDLVPAKRRFDIIDAAYEVIHEYEDGEDDIELE